MTQAKGYKAQLVADFETVFGQTPGTVNAVKLPIVSSQLKSKQNFIDSSVITGRRDPAEPAKGNIDLTGTVVVPVDEVAIGYWLKAMFGAPATSGSADPYMHVFKTGDTQPSLVLEQGFTDIRVYELFNGCKVNKFSLTLGGDAELTASIDLMGAMETIRSASFAGSPANISLAKYNNFQASIKESGANIATVSNVSLNMEFGLAGDSYAIGGNGCRTGIPEGLLKITGNLKAFFEDQSLLNKAMQGTESSLSLKLTNMQHSLELLLPEIVFERNSPGIEGAKGILIDLPFRAYCNNNPENTAIMVTLVNSQAAY